MLRTFVRPTLLVAITAAAAAIASAQISTQGPAVGTSTSSNLQLNANVQTAVQLNISNAEGGAAVQGSNATGLFSIDFGNVNGFGLGSPAAGVHVDVDPSGALYKTPVVLTPVYSGFTTETAKIEVTQDAAGDTSLAREGDSEISASSTVDQNDSRIVASSVESGASITRYVGMYAARNEAAGQKTATLIYTVSVQ